MSGYFEAPDALVRGKRLQYLLNRRLGYSQIRRREKSLFLPEIKPDFLDYVHSKLHISFKDVIASICFRLLSYIINVSSMLCGLLFGRYIINRM